MSITALPTVSVDGEENKAEGVRTYRGRSLAELIPRIRAELGSDAIILREREGLIGGVNGFFAKRCVEVDARRATRIDVYDDDDDADGDGDQFAEDGEELIPAPNAARAQARAEAIRRARRATAARRERPEGERTPAGELTGAPEAESGAESELLPEPLAAGLPARRDDVPRAAIDTVIEDQQSFADQLLAAQDVGEGESQDAGVGVTPARPRPLPEPSRALAELSAPVAELPAPAAESPAPLPVPATSRKPVPAPRRTSLSLTLPGHRAKRAERRFDPAAAATIGRELAAQGFSQAAAARLVSEAAAHKGPFAPQGDLRDAVRRAIADSIPRPKSPPAHGAAVAFVGAGGAGKTRSAAALATAYARSSTLSVSVIALGSSDRGRAIKEMLKAERAEVKSASGVGRGVRQAAQHRTGSMIVVDTGAVAPGNQDAVRMLSDQLDGLALDAIYVTLPATLGAHAARQLLEGLEPLSPNGIVITHADETDQLGVAIELASSRGIPVAYIHEDLDLLQPISCPDPVDLAKRLLP